MFSLHVKDKVNIKDKYMVDTHKCLHTHTHTHFINNNINNLLCVDGVYTDLSKAFDTISHVKLLSKLHAYGIQGSLLDWIKSFLTNRSQSVSINSALSSSKPCISGAPQGCILSPLFFLIFINDLSDCISHSSIYLYADDAKLLSLSLILSTVYFFKKILMLSLLGVLFGNYP